MLGGVWVVGRGRWGCRIASMVVRCVGRGGVVFWFFVGRRRAVGVCGGRWSLAHLLVAFVAGPHACHAVVEFGAVSFCASGHVLLEVVYAAFEFAG